MLSDILLNVIPALLCITLHEISHGFVAYKLGDPTAKNMGRLTLNPIKHIDIVGLIMMVFAGFGWAKAVPVDMRNFKNPKRDMAITAAAGPISNFIIAVFMLLLYGLLYYPLVVANAVWADTILSIISKTATLSTALAIFNIIPIPPLDGSKVLFSFLNEKHYYTLMKYERYGMIVLVVLLLTNVLDGPLNTAVSFLMDKMFVVAEFGFEIAKKFI